MILAGPMLDGYLADGKTLRFPSSVPVTSPADAVSAVQSLAAQHVDFIKVQSELPDDAYLAAAAESHRLGLPIVGHVPTRVRIGETITAGQKSIEHLMGIFEACSTKEDQFVTGAGSLQLLLDTYDAPRCDALLHRLAQAQVWQCPTLVSQEREILLDQLDDQHQPLARYVPSSWRASWHRFGDELMVDVRKDPLARRQDYWHRNLTMTAALHHAGVPLLAGTDAAPIAPGALADLVLLSANPLIDIHNTTTVQAVVANGRVFNRAALDQLLHDAELAARRL
jgi:imidazolonepropionase-like amidohydrolase